MYNKKHQCLAQAHTERYIGNCRNSAAYGGCSVYPPVVQCVVAGDGG